MANFIPMECRRYLTRNDDSKRYAIGTQCPKYLRGE